MAEERTLGLVRAQEQPADDLSKEDLQRRLDETRHSISETVTEIKETVQHQVQAVKDTRLARTVWEATEHGGYTGCRLQ